MNVSEIREEKRLTAGIEELQARFDSAKKEYSEFVIAQKEEIASNESILNKMRSQISEAQEELEKLEKRKELLKRMYYPREKYKAKLDREIEEKLNIIQELADSISELQDKKDEDDETGFSAR